MGNNSLNWQHFERSLACVVLDTKQSHMLFRTVAVFLCRGMLANANTPATTQWQVQGSYLPQRGRSEHRRTETRRVTEQQQQITELQSHSFTSPSSRRDVEPVAADFTSPCWVTDTCCRLLWFQRDFLGVWWRTMDRGSAWMGVHSLRGMFGKNALNSDHLCHLDGGRGLCVHQGV